MPSHNPLIKLVNTANRLPNRIGSRLLTFAFTSKVKFAGTAGLKIIQATDKSVTMFQANKKKTQNHIGGIHAAAMALLAESASGFVVGLNLPNGKLPLIKSMNIDYLKRAQGALTAVARITEDQISMMQKEDKGEAVIEVEVHDESNAQPIQCKMIWAWIPKKT